MNDLLIRISGTFYDNAEITVNGQKQSFTNNGKGSYELTVNADESVEITIERRHELSSSLWLLWGLLYFVISCFGIFDVPYSKRMPLIFKASITSEGGGVAQFNPSIKKDGKAVAVACKNCVVEEKENSLNEALVKKRRKTLTVIKLLLWLALIAVVAVIAFTR